MTATSTKFTTTTIIQQNAEQRNKTRTKNTKNNTIRVPTCNKTKRSSRRIMIKENLREILVPRTYEDPMFFYRKAIVWHNERIAGRSNDELRLGKKIIAAAYSRSDEFFNGDTTGSWNTDFISLNVDKFLQMVDEMGIDRRNAWNAVQLAGDFETYADIYYRYTGKKPISTSDALSVA